jgi:CspA family cold shock protein
MEERISGIVRWFNVRAGYGFIVRLDKNEDVFVHHSEIQGVGFKSLSENDIVEFEVEQGAKGPRAVNVVKVQA